METDEMNEEEELLQVVTFDEVKPLLERAGFVFREGPRESIYALPGKDPQTNPAARASQDFFYILWDFRANLCKYGVPDSDVWKPQERECIEQWVRHHIVGSLTTTASATSLPKPEEISCNEAFGLLKKLKFTFAPSKLSTSEHWFFPGFKKDSVSNKEGVTEFASDKHLVERLVRCGFPQNTEWGRLETGERIQLEMHFANLSIEKPDTYWKTFQDRERCSSQNPVKLRACREKRNHADKIVTSSTKKRAKTSGRSKSLPPRANRNLRDSPDVVVRKEPVGVWTSFVDAHMDTSMRMRPCSIKKSGQSYVSYVETFSSAGSMKMGGTDDKGERWLLTKHDIKSVPSDIPIPQSCAIGESRRSGVVSVETRAPLPLRQVISTVLSPEGIHVVHTMAARSFESADVYVRKDQTGSIASTPAARRKQAAKIRQRKLPVPQARKKSIASQKNEDLDKKRYEVEDILARRRQKPNAPYEYKVKWKDCPMDECTWEPRRIFQHSYELTKMVNSLDNKYQQDMRFEKILSHRNELEFLVRWNDSTPDSWISKSDLIGDKVKEAADYFFRYPGQRAVGNDNDPLVYCRSFTSVSPADTKDSSSADLLVNAKIVVANQSEEPKSFLETMLSGRVQIVEHPLTKDCKIQRIGTLGDKTTYELVCVKSKRDKAGGGGHGGMYYRQSVSTLKLYYIATSGPGLETLDLQAKLEEFSDFQSLEASKAPSRLELLVTPPLKECPIEYPLDASMFEFIPEECNEGCGFIPEDTLDALVGKKGKYKGADSIQVRVVAPKLGTLKGMLMRKRGISKIQISIESMQKVDPSRTHHDSWVAITVKGAFPSSHNKNLGCCLDPAERKPPKDFKGPTKPLSEMYQGVLVGLGIPKKVVDNYVDRAKRSGYALRHTHLKGVADPTGCLPPGTIFITGHVQDSRTNDPKSRALFGQVNRQVLVTRSPCMEPSDLKLLKVVGTQPPEMPDEKWEFLCGLKFGHLIFSRAKPGHTPLPALVGEGDLDGDDYCVFWDSCLLRELGKTKRVKELERIHQKKSPSCQAKPKTTVDSPRRPRDNKLHWFVDVQNTMVDTSRYRAVHRLTGHLYGQCKTIMNESDFFHNDVHIFAQAYKTSMDLLKHGGKVVLPYRFLEQVPKECQECCEED